MNPACQDRANSNVAQQALYLLNNRMVRDLSDRFARNLKEAGTAPAAGIQHLYLSALSRRPTIEELEIGSSTLADLEKEWTEYYSTQADDAKGDPALEALRVYCHAILNSAGFLYVD
jgi:hypothetical protein